MHLILCIMEIYWKWYFHLIFPNLLVPVPIVAFVLVSFYCHSSPLYIENFCCRLSKWYSARLCKNLEQIDECIQIAHKMCIENQTIKNVGILKYWKRSHIYIIGMESISSDGQSTLFLDSQLIWVNFCLIFFPVKHQYNN